MMNLIARKTILFDVLLLISKSNFATGWDHLLLNECGYIKDGGDCLFHKCFYVESSLFILSSSPTLHPHLSLFLHVHKGFHSNNYFCQVSSKWFFGKHKYIVTQQLLIIICFIVISKYYSSYTTSAGWLVLKSIFLPGNIFFPACKHTL